MTDETKTEKKSRLPLILAIVVMGFAAMAYGYIKMTSDSGIDGKAELGNVTSKVEGATNTDTQSSSQAYIEKSRERDRQEAEEARQSGGSAVPRLVGQTSDIPLVIQRQEPPKAAPAPVAPSMSREEQQRLIQQEVARLERRRRVQEQNPYSAAIMSLMQSTVAENNRFTPSKVSILPPDKLRSAMVETRQAVDRDPEPVTKRAPIAMGTMLYAILDIGANSDQPNTPIVARVLGGPWAGAKVIGGFRREDEKLIIQFNKFSYKDQDYNFSGYAIDPKQYSPGVASDVNRHMLSRWGGLVASSLLEGIGRARERSGTTYTYGDSNSNDTVNVPKYDVADEMWIAGGLVGERAARQIEKGFDRAPTVVVSPGTQIGILVL